MLRVRVNSNFENPIMNQLSFPMRGLYWKEIRQVVPLVLMLIGVALLLAVFWSALQTTTLSMATFGPFIPLIMPALYAAGAGAILVGQEKETRTLLWFSSLPISPQQIIQVKFIVALGGLLAMWVCSVLVGGLVGIAGPAATSFMLTPGDEGFANTLYWILHSVFVLCCGFYTTWKLKNTFASLVALMPLAVIPYLVVQTFYWMFQGDRYVTIQESAWALALATAVAIPVFAWLAYAAAIKHLSPADAETDESGPASWLSAWRPANSVPIPESSFRYPLSSLVWQSIHQNRLTLVALFTLMFVGTVCCVLMISHPINKDYGGLLAGGVIAGFVALSWLGVFVFSGDGSAKGLRFLADRGVSPTLAWAGRQLIGLSMIAALALFYAIATYWFMHIDYLHEEYRAPFFSMLTVWFIAIVVYSVSQWIGQVIRILAASAFVAPVISLMAILWLGWTASQASAPAWSMVACVAIPMLATWLMMRWFMDDNTKWRTWAVVIGSMCAFFVLPIVPLAIEVLTWPTIPSSVRASLADAAMKIPPPQAAPQRMMLARPDNDEIRNAYTLIEEKALEFIASQDDSPAGTIAIGDMNLNSVVPLEYDRYVFETANQTAEYHKVLFKQNPSDEQALASLGQWIDAFAVIAKRLRLSERWVDQHGADTTEIWLTQTLSEPALEPYLDESFAQAALQVLGDQTTRNDLRRRAVLASWRDHQLLPPTDENVDRTHSFGGFYYPGWFDRFSTLKRDLVLNKQIDRLVATTIELIEAGEAGKDTEPMRRELSALILGPEAPFALGPYSTEMQSGASVNHSSPASQWYAAWESEAKQLANERGN